MARVLLLEPDTILGHTYATALGQSSHKVIWCQTAQDAISDIDVHLPDIVVLELQLALHNGIEFLYEFRSYADWHHIPVIILSHVPPGLQAISDVLWDHLNVVAYHYKPMTKLVDLIKSVDSTLVPAQ